MGDDKLVTLCDKWVLLLEKVSSVAMMSTPLSGTFKFT